jgi:hypothetical protein
MNDSRDLDACRNCGHWAHPTGAAGSCAVVWMGERCGCRRLTLPDPHAYTAAMYGSSWADGPVTDHPTITAVRRWAEEYGTTADLCIIRDHRGREVARHVRDTSGDGTRWHRGTL